jgi:hypothetical protein
MPVFCKCVLPGCTFNGNHGFTNIVGGIAMFYHTIPGQPERMENSHCWYSAIIDPSQIERVKVGTAERFHDGNHYLDTPSLSEAFELCVVPRDHWLTASQATDIWIEAYRAEIAGKPRRAKAVVPRMAWRGEHALSELGRRSDEHGNRHVRSSGTDRSQRQSSTVAEQLPPGHQGRWTEAHVNACAFNAAQLVLNHCRSFSTPHTPRDGGKRLNPLRVEVFIFSPSTVTRSGVRQRQRTGSSPIHEWNRKDDSEGTHCQPVPAGMGRWLSLVCVSRGPARSTPCHCTASKPRTEHGTRRQRNRHQAHSGSPPARRSMKATRTGQIVWVKSTAQVADYFIGCVPPIYGPDGSGMIACGEASHTATPGERPSISLSAASTISRIPPRHDTARRRRFARRTRTNSRRSLTRSWTPPLRRFTRSPLRTRCMTRWRRTRRNLTTPTCGSTATRRIVGRSTVASNGAEMSRTIDQNRTPRIAWTGGSMPTRETRRNDNHFRFLRKMFFCEQVCDCGGLDLWACAGTSALERARIFWRRATADAWATVRGDR